MSQPIPNMSLHAFLGTRALRLAQNIDVYEFGDEWHESDTGDIYKVTVDPATHQLVWVLLASGGSPFVVDSYEVWISPTGSATATGTEADPFDSLLTAVLRGPVFYGLNGGDYIIHAAAGTYASVPNGTVLRIPIRVSHLNRDPALFDGALVEAMAERAVTNVSANFATLTVNGAALTVNSLRGATLFDETSGEMALIVSNGANTINLQEAMPGAQIGDLVVAQTPGAVIPIPFGGDVAQANFSLIGLGSQQISQFLFRGVKFSLAASALMRIDGAGVAFTRSELSLSTGSIEVLRLATWFGGSPTGLISPTSSGRILNLGETTAGLWVHGSTSSVRGYSTSISGAADQVGYFVATTVDDLAMNAHARNFLTNFVGSGVFTVMSFDEFSKGGLAGDPDNPCSLSGMTIRISNGAQLNPVSAVTIAGTSAAVDVGIVIIRGGSLTQLFSGSGPSLGITGSTNLVLGWFIDVLSRAALWNNTTLTGALGTFKFGMGGAVSGANRMRGLFDVMMRTATLAAAAPATTVATYNHPTDVIINQLVGASHRVTLSYVGTGSSVVATQEYLVSTRRPQLGAVTVAAAALVKETGDAGFLATLTGKVTFTGSGGTMLVNVANDDVNAVNLAVTVRDEVTFSREVDVAPHTYTELFGSLGGSGYLLDRVGNAVVQDLAAGG